MEYKTIVPKELGPGTPGEQAAIHAADNLTVNREDAHAADQTGDHERADDHDERAKDDLGNNPDITATAYLVQDPTSGKSAFFHANKKQVMDILHGRALEEDAAHTSETTPAKISFLGKIGLGHKR